MSGRNLSTVRSRVGATTALFVMLLFSVAFARSEGAPATPPAAPPSAAAAPKVPTAPRGDPAAAPAPGPAPGAAVAGAAAVKPEDTPAGQLFGTRCTPCHNIGQGRKIGPDLLGVTTRRTPEWIRKFLTSPGKAIDSGDPIATQLFKEANGVRMPEQEFKPAEIEQLLEFFSLCTAKGGCKPGPAIKLGIDGSDEQIESGRDLALGKKPLSAGGPACTECHHFRGASLLGGGNLGPDLSASWGRLHDAGWVEKLLASPIEKKTYEGHDLTDDEKFELRAFFASLSRDGTRDPIGGDFFDFGALGALALLGVIGVTWSSRNGEKA